jgi:asparagine synthase (glutamine-hydrolysing)
MCGITGIARFKHQDNCVEKVRSMNRQIAHRGPDAEGVWSHPFCVLGHRRLSIIDTSAAGNQPFKSDNEDLVIVFNGEIYNYLELRKELEDTHSFKTQTDTEVILASYKKWGIDCVKHFFGMFAFALWDEKQAQLLIARDRLGVKPLYYSDTENGFVFASEFVASMLKPRPIICAIKQCMLQTLSLKVFICLCPGTAYSLIAKEYTQSAGGT